MIAGNPAKIICTLEEHYHNRKRKTADEALFCARKYHERFGKWPKPAEMNRFKFLFAPREEKIVHQYRLNFDCNGDEKSEVIEEFYKSRPIWKDYDTFLRMARKERMR